MRILERNVEEHLKLCFLPHVPCEKHRRSFSVETPPSIVPAVHISMFRQCKSEGHYSPTMFSSHVFPLSVKHIFIPWMTPESVNGFIAIMAACFL